MQSENVLKYTDMDTTPSNEVVPKPVKHYASAEKSDDDVASTSSDDTTNSRFLCFYCFG
jgi:hypothetical protein